ncbi:MAG: M20/M25/M40 family metallo-hydrolase [Candidatus Lokiarchaeota archaeon]|nr:M20/M25/M40 family metallo-hydrolase [Candidatus Lokiarchaeota archaeon]
MTFKEDFKLLKELSELQSCSGNESDIREYIKDTIKDICDAIETDYLGNLICYLNSSSKRKSPGLKILLDAHMDEIGFIVRFIDKNGFIRFSQIGGQNPRILPGQKITVHSSVGENIIGIIGEKPIHLIDKKERKKTSDIEDLFIDIGLASKEEVEKYVSVGDYITLQQECTAFTGNKRLFSKAFDDRIGCFVLIKLIQELGKNKQNLPHKLIFLFTSQEEIGVRGATVGTYNITPDIGIAIEVTHAIDYPGLSKEKYYECTLGSGVSISIGPNIYAPLAQKIISLAKDEQIPFILEAEPRQALNDGRAIQLTKQGIPTAILSVPLRYMHTNIEMVEYQDILYLIDLVKAFLQKDLGQILSLE